MAERDAGVPMLGRDADVTWLVRTLGAAIERGVRGAIVLGEPGIGKTRLLSGVTERLAADGFSARWGSGTELGQLRPLAPVLEALGLDAPAPPAAAAPGAYHYRLLDGIGDALETAGRAGPVLLVIDDLQWADPLTMRFLRAVPQRVTGLPVAVLMAARPMPREPEFIRALTGLAEVGIERHQLGPLDESSVERLAATLTGGLTDNLRRGIKRAGGNPLYVLELLRSDALDGQVASGTLGVLIERRVAELTPDALQALRIGAVLGPRFAPGLVAELLGRPTGAVVPAFDEAIEASLLISEGHELAFRHDVVREVIAHGISSALRASLHREAARALLGSAVAPEIVAAHLQQAGDDPSVVPLLREAADHVAATAPGVAAELLDRATSSMPAGDPDRAALLVQLVRALAWTGRLDDARARAELAFGAGLDAVGEIRLRAALAEAMVFRGMPEAVLEQVEEARCVADGASDELAPLHAAAAHAHLFTGDGDAVDNEARAAIAASDRTGDVASACFARLAQSMLLRTRGQLTGSLAAAEDAVRRADAGPIEARQRQPRLFLAPALSALGRAEEADLMYTRGRRGAEELGAVWALPSWSAFRSNLLRSLGRWDEAVAEAEAALEVGDELELRNVAPMAHAVIAEISAHRGDFADARRHLARAEALAQAGVEWTLHFRLWGSAAVADLTGDPAAAVAALGGGDVDAGLLNVLAVEHGPAPQLVRMMLAIGETTGAKRIVAQVKSIAEREEHVTVLRAAADHCEGLLRRDAVLLQRAASAFLRTPFRPAAGAAAEDAGVASAAAGDIVTATALLEQAYDVFSALAADRDLARVTGALRGIGVRRLRRRTPRVQQSGWQGLTPAEVEVARLVAEGLSNPQIAQRLFISRYTVESHLKRIFVKLEIASRVQLAGLVLRHDTLKDP